jgi:hypothetical protein
MARRTLEHIQMLSGPERDHCWSVLLGDPPGYKTWVCVSSVVKQCQRLDLVFYRATTSTP